VRFSSVTLRRIERATPNRAERRSQFFLRRAYLRTSETMALEEKAEILKFQANE